MNRNVPSYNNNNGPQQRFENPAPTYEDDDEEDDEGSEEFGSYESYFSPHQRPSSSSLAPPPPQPKPTIPTNTKTNHFGHRHGLPASQHQPQPQSPNPIPMISRSGTKVSLSSPKDKEARRNGNNTQIVNSKPLRRPKPVEDPQNLDSGGDPLGFKPVVAFPFTIPKAQDKFSLGLKLSGCNIYGKMYQIDQVIHELSSICVQCKCTEVGVQCSELQC